MDLCFGKVKRTVAAQQTMEGLRVAIVGEIPGLADHQKELKVSYIDDEGDEIRVTMSDELQEAFRVAKTTNNGILVLNLVVPEIAESTQTAIEGTASRKVAAKTHIPPVAVAVATAANSTTDVIQTLREAGTSAVAELNSVLGSAATEIDRLFCQLGTASTKQKATEKQLEAAKTELKEATLKQIADEQKVHSLQEQLATAKSRLAETMAQQKRDAARLGALESQVAESAEWANKFQVAEEQRLRFEHQLQHLRSGLMGLAHSTTEPKTPTEIDAPEAAVISSEVVLSSPVVSPVIAVPAEADVVEVPVSLPELPPPYEAPSAEPTAVFPANCPAPSPLELKMQQLHDMGFHLTIEQLQEKLVEHSDNMEHVINSLL